MFSRFALVPILIFEVIELAVRGMLPKGPLGRSMIKKLHVYAGPDHAHQAQKPEVLTF